MKALLGCLDGDAVKLEAAAVDDVFDRISWKALSIFLSAIHISCCLRSLSRISCAILPILLLIEVQDNLTGFWGFGVLGFWDWYFY